MGTVLRTQFVADVGDVLIDHPLSHLQDGCDGSRANTSANGHAALISAATGGFVTGVDVALGSTMRLLAGGTPFRMEGLSTVRDTVKLEAGLGYAVSNRIMLQLSYTGQIAADARQNAVSGRFSLRF